jgi:hypothetical protein
LLAGLMMSATAVAVTFAGATTGLAAGVKNCNGTSVSTSAITDLTAPYLGEPGGLYPDGTNTPPADYEAAGVAAGKAIQPLDTLGRPSATGRILLISVGMSETNLEFGYFQQQEMTDPLRSRAVRMINGAYNMYSPSYWMDPNSAAWLRVEQNIHGIGSTDPQVQAIWLQEADPFVTTDFETTAHNLANELTTITAVAAAKYVNLKQVYISSRTYAGYTIGAGNPEPFAYWNGFANKFAIQVSISNPTALPWVGWGAYLWTNGLLGRADGMVWLCSDTQSDGNHPSLTGQAKVSGLMHAQWTTSEFSPWFHI